MTKYMKYWGDQLKLLLNLLNNPDGTVVTNLPGSARDPRDMGLIPGLGRSAGGENGNLLPYSCLENPMGRGAWQATVHGVAESDMT